MSVHPLSWRNRALGLLIGTFIIMMVAAVIASSGLAAAPANSVRPTLTVADDPPGAPTNLTATALSASEIGLSWTNPSGSLTDNHVYVYSGSTCSGSPTGYDLGGVYTSYAPDPLTPSTTYSFEVTASNSGGEGPPSNCATATTPSPGAPTGLAATAISTTEIGLSWTNPSGYLTDNKVYVYSGSSCSGSPTDFDLGGVYTSYAATGLTPTTNYSFEVTASTSGIEGPPSNCATATTPPPGAPTGLVATTASAHKINLSWTNPWETLTANTVYEYSSGCSTLLDTYIIAVATTYTATGLKSATTYCFTVSASMSGGAGPQSASASATTFNAKPSAPTGLTATAASDSAIVLTWTNPSGTLTNNKVYIYSDSDCQSLIGSGSIGVTTWFVWSGQPPSTTFSFEVTAVTNGGEGSPSNCAFATTFNAPPSAPTGLTATAASDSAIVLTWTNPSGTLTGNNVYIYSDSDCQSLIGSGSAGGVTTSFVWSGQPSDTLYGFEVTAVTNGSEGPASNCAFATTFNAPPPAPTGLTATGVSASEIDLAWTNPSGTLTGNTVYEYSSDCSTLLNTFVIVVASTYTVTGLAGGTTYCFTVSATTNGGEGPQSAAATATTSGGGIIGVLAPNLAGATVMVAGTVSASSAAQASLARELRTFSR